jgi:hypothetical protein|tara:strand:- start:265 stop:378 length:114 start_codon:yes stop_codon:yes gene_type:complete
MSFGDSGIKFGFKKEQDDMMKKLRKALTQTINRMLIV